MRLKWDAPSKPQIEQGLDRAVIYFNDGRSVVWQGLTSVEETGGEAVSTYYVDGVPFLFLPKPKEFSATLKSYTYPDELHETIGIIETPNGLLLDSQMSDSFCLRYRTRVGDDY